MQKGIKEEPYTDKSTGKNGSVQNGADKEAKPFSSSKNVQLLLLIEALKDTNPQNPKNVPELTKEIGKRWQELFPAEPENRARPYGCAEKGRGRLYRVRTACQWPADRQIPGRHPRRFPDGKGWKVSQTGPAGC